MARSRDAVDTIKGYYYQFDYFIFQLISLVNEEDTVTIEGIEDVDILEEKEMVLPLSVDTETLKTVGNSLVARLNRVKRRSRHLYAR